MLKNCKVISKEIPRLRFFLYTLYVSELITHMPSYHCSDNVSPQSLYCDVSIEWNKGNQAFKLCIHIHIVFITHMPSYHCSDMEQRMEQR